MINFNSIKRSVAMQILRQKFNPDDGVKDNTNRILATALIINTIETLISHDPSYSSKVTELAKNYSGTYRSEVLSLENKYATYSEMRYYVETVCKINTPLNLTQSQVNRIIELYKGKLAIKEFSISTYSHLMYNVTNLKYSDDLRLKDIHKNVFVPIAKHYIAYNAVHLSDIKVTNVEYNVPGKTVDLAIQGIDPAVIKADLDKDTMNIADYIYKSYLTVDGHVRIVTKTK